MSAESPPSSTVSGGAIPTSAGSGPGPGGGRRWIWLAIVLVVVGAGVPGGWVLLSSGGSDAENGATAVVTRGDLPVSIKESGEVEAAKKKVIRNELPWPVVIEDVIEEGKIAEPNKPIITFQCKELEDAIYKQKLTVRSANSALLEAEGNLKLKKQEMENQVKKARQTVVDAQIDLVRYEEGEYPRQLAEAKREIQLQKRDLALARKKLQFKKDANADPSLKSPYSDSEIEADSLAVERLELAVQKAEAKKMMLEKYDHPREIRKLTMAVEDAKLALAKAELDREVQLRRAEEHRDAKKATWEDQKKELERLQEEKEKLEVTLPEPGLVVYNTGRSRWNPGDVSVEVGAEIKPKQQLMIIPDMSTLQVKTKVYEADISLIRSGMEADGGVKAYVRFDAMPGKTFQGHVTKVAVLASDKNRWLYPNVKLFDVIVKLDGNVENMMPNWTAEVELELARLKNVLQVPIAAVFTKQEKRYVWRLNADGPEQVDVTVGSKNDTTVEIKSGLKEGDRVLLAPPEGGEGAAEGEEDKDKAPAGAAPMAAPTE
jgi:HlyD family secretion protein